MQLCGNSFTLRGTVDDPTAVVVASIMDTNGNTTTISGEVERNGVLWAENLPLAEGTNWLTLSVTNAAGFSSATNISVVKNDMTLGLTSIDGNLWSPTVNVGGVISDPSYSVWVNGVQGTNNGDGTWSVSNVPVSSGGVASFDVSAVNGGDPAISANVDKPARLYAESYAEADGSTSGETNYPTGCVWTYKFTGSSSCAWTNNVGGSGSFAYDFYFGNVDCGGGYSHPWETNSMSSPASPWENLTAGTNYQTSDWDENAFGYSGNATNYYTSGWTPPVAWEHCQVKLPVNITVGGAYQWQGDWYGVGPNTRGEYHRTADAVLKLQTGGKALSRRQNLFQLTVSAAEMTDKHAYYDGGGFYYDDVYHPTKPIPSAAITIDGKPVGSDGNQWRAYADNDTRDVTPRVKNLDFYTFNVTQQKYKLRIIVNGSNPLWPDHVPAYNKYCVGQYLGFDQEFTPELPETPQCSPVQWVLDGTYVNTNIPAQFSDGSSNYTNDTTLLKGLSTHAWWVSGGLNPSATYRASLGEGLTFANGQYVVVTANGKFNMFRPQILGHGFITHGAINLITNNLPEVGLVMPSGQWMSWRTQVGLDINFPAMLFHAQLLNGGFYWDVPYPAGIPYTCLGETHTTSDGTWLDNSYPYESTADEIPVNTGPATTTTNAAISFADGPDMRSKCCSFAQLTFDFNNFLCFQPTSAGSIPVTLERVEWLMNGRTDLVGANWTLTTKNMAGPYFNSDDSFPQWPHTFHTTPGE